MFGHTLFVFALKNPGLYPRLGLITGFAHPLFVFALKNPWWGFYVVRARSQKNPGRVDRSRSQKPPPLRG